MSIVLRERLVFRAALLFSIAPSLMLAQGADLAAESHHARELMAAHRFEEAIPIYENLLKAVPGNTGLLLNLAMAEQMAGHLARSIPHFEAVLKAQPDNVPALMSLSMVRLEMNQPGEALAPLKKLVALDATDRDALGMLAEAEMSTNRLQDAAARYRQLTAIDNQDPRAWYGLGKAYEALATHALERLNSSAPESPYVAVLLAETRLERRQYRSAFFFYRAAEAKSPDLPGIHAGLALVYRGAGHSDWASSEEKREASLPAPDCTREAAECEFLGKHFLRAAEAATSNATPATLFWGIKAYNQLAAEAFDHLNQLPESIELHAFKAQTLRDHNRSIDAVNEWRAAAKLAPNSPKVKRELASALFDAKDYQSAIPLLEEELRREPRAPDLNYMLGASLWHVEQAEKALPYLESSLRAGTPLTPADGVIGLVLVSLNRNTEAIPHLERALSLDDDGSLHYSLARAYQAAGKTELAAKTIEEYQQIQKQNQKINGQLDKEAEITAPLP